MRVAHRWTGRAAGDLADAATLDSLGLPGAPTWLRQVHGGDVVVVTAPGEHAGAEADAAVTAAPECPLVVRTADCAALVLEGDGTLGVVHAGWRGLVAGIVQAAAATMAELGGAPRRARLGPCIRAGCYEFDGPELASLARRYGTSLSATTTWGTPALDLAAGVAAACHEADVAELVDEGACTACDPRWFSHRARGDLARQGVVAWLDPTGPEVGST